MTKFIFFLGIIVFSITTLNGQTDDDNIALLRVQNQISVGNYTNALIILKGISLEGKKNPFYLSYSATCYEKTNNFDSAIVYYKQLYTLTKSFDAMKKVAEMMDLKAALDKKNEDKKYCTRCYGTGFYTAYKKCYRCHGYGTVDTTCEKSTSRNFIWGCNGTKKCNDCKGTGLKTCIREGLYSREYYNCDCTRCNGSGKCDKCKGTGTEETTCSRCNGSKEIGYKAVCEH